MIIKSWISNLKGEGLVDMHFYIVSMWLFKEQVQCIGTLYEVL